MTQSAFSIGIHKLKIKMLLAKACLNLKKYEHDYLASVNYNLDYKL